MSEIGFYRYKANVSQDSEVKLYINYALASTKQIVIKDWCEDNKRIKFLNRDGQYRFTSFNRFYEYADKPKQIGKVNKLITSLLDSQSDTDSVGVRNERMLYLTADDISEAELNIMKDLWTSPRVFLYVGDGITDVESDYVQVIIKAKNPVNNIPKGSYIDLRIEVKLPKHYTITMI